MGMTRMIAVKPATMEFQRITYAEPDHSVALMPLLNDPETGMEAFMVRYEAGEVTPTHTHGCGHAMYIVSGRIRANDGEFGPGELLWFPEGSVAEHGATEDGPADVLFFTNKPFTIELLEP